MSQVDFDRYMECSLALAVDLTNSHDPATGRNDGLVDLGTLASFLAEHNVTYRPRPTSSDLEQVWRLAATLREVFEAQDETAAVRILNRLLAKSGGRPELTNHDGEPWHLHYSAPGMRLAPRLAAEAAMALAVLTAEGGFERLHVCEGERCVDVFVDQSRNRSRRYCSPQVCGNRASVAAFRARKRAGQLRLISRPDDERSARVLAEVLDLAERLPWRPRRKLAYPPFNRRLG